MGIPVGAVARIPVVLTDVDTKQPVDPATITVTVQDPTGATTAHGWQTSPNDMVKLASGSYKALQDTTAKPGQWQYEIRTTSPQGAWYGGFIVDSSPFG